MALLFSASALLISAMTLQFSASTLLFSASALLLSELLTEQFDKLLVKNKFGLDIYNIIDKYLDKYYEKVFKNQCLRIIKQIKNKREMNEILTILLIQTLNTNFLYKLSHSHSTL